MRSNANAHCLICYYFGKLFQWILLTEDYDKYKSIGSIGYPILHNGSADRFYLAAAPGEIHSIVP